MGLGSHGELGRDNGLQLTSRAGALCDHCVTNPPRISRYQAKVSLLGTLVGCIAWFFLVVLSFAPAIFRNQQVIDSAQADHNWVPNWDAKRVF